MGVPPAIIYFLFRFSIQLLRQHDYGNPPPWHRLYQWYPNWTPSPLWRAGALFVLSWTSWTVGIWSRGYNDTWRTQIRAIWWEWDGLGKTLCYLYIYIIIFSKLYSSNSKLWTLIYLENMGLNNLELGHILQDWRQSPGPSGYPGYPRYPALNNQ